MTTTQVDTEVAARIDAAARAALERYHVPGISIGVVRGDDLVYSEAFGHADIEASVPADVSRHQRIASITKTMTGLCVTALVDEGRLSLDSRVVDLLPDVRFDGPARSMTVRHLLTHTSGIGEAPTMDALAATIDPNARPTGRDDFASLYRHGIILEAEPGAKRAYANHGYALLGEIVARTEVAGFGEVVRRRIFEPLGMEDSTCTREGHPNLSTGYHRAPSADTRELLERAGRPIPDETPVDGHNIRGDLGPNDHHGMLAAGAAQSTIADMARYASALLRRGGGIVRPETFDAMVGPQFCPHPRLTSWGLSFERWNALGRDYFGHTGSYFGGWNSSLAVFPTDDFAVIVHMNVMMDSSASVYALIHRALFDIADTRRPQIAHDTSVLDAAPGVFECAPGKLTNFRASTNLGRIQISRDGDHLVVHSRRGAFKQGCRLLRIDESDPLIFDVEREEPVPTRLLLTRGSSGAIDGLWCDDLVRMFRTDQVAPWA